MKNLPIRAYLIGGILLLSSLVFAQKSDTLRRKQNRNLFYASSAIAYSSSMTALYFLWYKDIPSQTFHFFDDSNQWLGMDKLGHMQTSWATSAIIYDQMVALQQSDKEAIRAAIVIPQIFMTSVEIFDGFSSAWGFSWADIGANVLGLSLFLIRQKAFEKQMVEMKFSYSSSGLAGFRPDVLGSATTERWLKDYSGQTYYFSFSPGNLKPLRNKWPQWLCLSAGMGGRNMLGGTTNSWEDLSGKQNDFSYLNRYREWSLSFDINLKAIPIKGKFWKAFSSAFCWLKIPSPAVYFSKQNGILLKPLYY